MLKEPVKQWTDRYLLWIKEVSNQEYNGRFYRMADAVRLKGMRL